MFADEDFENKSGEEQPPGKSSDQEDPWITAPMSKAKPAPEPEKEKPASKTQDDEGWATAGSPSAAPSATAEKAPPVGSAASTPLPSSESQGFPGSLLSSIGISDPGTQRWVLIGLGVLVALCCACACVVVAITVFTSS